VKGEGIGGRIQETALSAAEDIAGVKGIVIASLGTDGIDGNSKAAGAMVDGDTVFRAKRQQMNPHDFLERNDSYRFFRRLSDNLVTGPTGTNVGDLYLVVSADSDII
jgi:glycerate-2-kinase